MASLKLAVSSTMRRVTSSIGNHRMAAGISRRTMGLVAHSGGDISFATPESDFTSQGVRDVVWKTMSSPSDEHRSMLIQTTKKTETFAQEIASHFSFTSPESDFTAQSVRDAVVQNDSKQSHSTIVPKTFREALLERHAAIVVTTATSPHTILYVNRPWEDLCGYTLNDVRGKTLDCIQGKETNRELVDTKVHQLEEDHNHHHDKDELDMYLINYRKNGEKFTNHLTIGTITLNEDIKDVEFMVGVLEEVQPNEVPLRMI